MKKIKSSFKAFVKKYAYDKYFVLAIFFFCLQVLILIADAHMVEYNRLFWFCNHTPLIFGFAFLLGKNDLIRGIINVVLLLQVSWILDFSAKIMFNSHILGVTAYVFEAPDWFLVATPIFVHFLTTTIAFWAVFRDKPRKISLAFSAFYIILVFILTAAYTVQSRNVNCVFWICGLKEYTPGWYTFVWPVLIFGIFAAPTFWIQRIVYGYYIKHRK